MKVRVTTCEKREKGSMDEKKNRRTCETQNGYMWEEKIRKYGRSTCAGPRPIVPEAFSQYLRRTCETQSDYMWKNMIYGRDTCQHPKSTVPEAFSQFSERLVKIRMATCLKKKEWKKYMSSSQICCARSFQTNYQKDLCNSKWPHVKNMCMKEMHIRFQDLLCQKHSVKFSQSLLKFRVATCEKS